MASHKTVVQDIILTVLTFGVAFSFREFLISLINYLMPGAEQHKIMFLAFITLVMLVLTLFLANYWKHPLHQ